MIAIQNFLKLIAKTENAVFSRLLLMRHKAEKHTADEWHAILKSMRGEEAGHGPVVPPVPPAPVPVPAAAVEAASPSDSQ